MRSWVSVYCDLFRRPSPLNCFLEKELCRCNKPVLAQQEVNGIALLISIKSLIGERDYDTLEKREVYVDGEKIGEGYYGGEPEDNSRQRDYSWVENLLLELSKSLGAEVEI